MRSPSKEVNDFMAEVARYCKEQGRRTAWEHSGGSHIKLLDGDTLRPITDAKGIPLVIPATPSDWRWMPNARAEFRRAGVLPRPIRVAPSTRQIQQRTRTLPDRVGRALRSDLPKTTRRALLQEISALVRRVAELAERDAA